MRKIKKIENELELLRKRVDNLYRKNEYLCETLAFITNHIDTTNLVEIDALGLGVRYVYDGKLRFVSITGRVIIIESNDKYIIVKRSRYDTYQNTLNTNYFKIDKATNTCADVTDLYLKVQDTAAVKTTKSKVEATDGT